MRIAELFPGRDVGAMHAQMTQFAAGFGVTMKFSERLPNTRRPLAMAEYARDQGHLEAFREAAMDAHWSRGVDIESDGVLRELAKDAGLDPDLALAAADSAPMQARVDALGDEA